jgi:hypothetical protein
MLSYDLWYENEQTREDGDDGCDEYSTGREVFYIFYAWMLFEGDEVGEFFQAGVEDLCHPEETGDDGQRGGFEIRNVKQETGDDDGYGSDKMDTGVVFPANELPKAADGVGKAFYTTAQREFFGLHDRSLGWV